MAANPITVRRLNPVTWDPLNGNGQNNFIYGREAVAQILAQRLKLFEGEWWENLLDGTPMFQSILGASGSEQNIKAIIAILSKRINGTQGVVQILSLQATFQNRKFLFNAEVQTEYGIIYLTNAPASQAII